MRRYFLLIFFSFLLIGALGLRTVDECNNDPKITRDSQRMHCYHTSAITAAYLGDTALAKSICWDIWYVYGQTNLGADTDIVEKAELVSNSCYYNIALILRDPVVCENIYNKREAYDPTGTADSELFGEEVNYDMCVNETKRLQKITAATYHAPGNDSLCTVVAIIPFLVLFAFLKTRDP